MTVLVCLCLRRLAQALHTPVCRAVGRALNGTNNLCLKAEARAGRTGAGGGGNACLADTRL